MVNMISWIFVQVVLAEVAIFFKIGELSLLWAELCAPKIYILKL